MSGFTVVLIIVLAIVLVAGTVAVIMLIKKNKQITTPAVSNNSMTFNDDFTPINLSAMLPEVLSTPPDRNRMVKVDNKDLVATVDNYVANTAKVANNANAVHQAAEAAQNLVKVNIPVKDLYHIDADKVRFFVQENGKFAENAVGTPVDLGGIQAANIVNASMGVASMVVGQYYMKTINEKLETLTEDVSKISSFQDEEYKSKVLNIIRSIQEMADFKYEIMNVEEIRTNKIRELSDIKKDCKELLGQANIHITNAMKKCKDYKDYENKTYSLQEWVGFQRILSMALQQISLLEYTLYLGKMTKELSINSYDQFMADTEKVNDSLIEWHKEQLSICDIKIDEGVKHRGGVQWFWKLIKNEYENMDEETKYLIEMQMNNGVPAIEDKTDNFREDVTLIKENYEYYYLLPDEKKLTPRDHYKKLEETIDGCKAQYALLKVYEASKIKDITDSLSIICDELKAEVNKDRPADIYGKATKEEVIKSAEDMLNIKTDATFDELKIVGQGLYDRYMSEVIRTYAYEESKKGTVNDYKKLADEMIDCMLDELKQDGMYNGKISKNIDKEVDY